MQVPPEFHLPGLLLCDLLQNSFFYVIGYGHVGSPGGFLFGLKCDSPETTVSS